MALTFMGELRRFIETLGIEAKRNAPAAVMAMSVALAVASKTLPTWFTALSATTFLIGVVAATYGYLQQALKPKKYRLKAGRSSMVGVGTITRRGDDPTENKRPDSSPPSSSSPRPEEPLAPDEISRRYYLRQIRVMNQQMVERLRAQIFSLGARANVNLTVGVTICLAGFAVLGYFVFVESKLLAATVGDDKWLTVWFPFLTRITLVVFVEVFAYFFLNLYRSGLQDIKYFSNEITNSTFRVMALEAAMTNISKEAKGAKDVIDKLCLEMIKTERNFLLKKNETTHDLRQTELLMQHDKLFSTTVEKVLAMIGKTTNSATSAAFRRGASGSGDHAH
jgi:hypothetical protein